MKFNLFSHAGLYEKTSTGRYQITKNKYNRVYAKKYFLKMIGNQY